MRSSSSTRTPTTALARDVPAQVKSSRLVAELTIARRLLLWLPIWVLLLVALAGLVIAYQTPRTYIVPIGDPGDQAYVLNFHARLTEGARSYRWSDVYGYTLFPGLGGSRPFTLTVALDPQRDAPVTLIVNGSELFKKTLHSGWQTVQVAVGPGQPGALASRDTVLEIRAPDYRTEDAPTEPKGVKVSTITLEQSPVGGIIAPSISRLVLLEGTFLLVYLVVGRGLAGLAVEGRARRWGLLAAAATALLCGLWLAADHISIGAAGSHIALTVASMLAILVLTDWLAARFAPAMAPWQTRTLAAAAAIAFGLRFGGMALPQSFIIDFEWHMKWLRTLLSGDWQSLYFPGGLSSVPREWGLDVLIPKSPLFYFLFAPLGFLPFDMATLVKWLICLLDTSLIVPIFWFVSCTGGRLSGALWAAGLYAVTPLAFRAFAYGIMPTVLAQWLAALAFSATLVVLRRRTSLVGWVAYVLLLALTLLAFPTVAVFVSIVLVASALIWGVRGRRDSVRNRGPLQIVGALIVAWLLAMVAYYGIYMGPVLTSISAMLAPGPGGGTTVRWPGGWPDLLAWTADYIVTALPALLAIGGFALLLARYGQTSRRARQAVVLLTAWALIAPLFFVANYRVDMIGKHLFFVMVPAAVAGGVALFGLARRGRPGALLAGLAFATISWQALIFWVDRLVRAST